MKACDKTKRLAMIKRRHRVWLRQQVADVSLPDESTAGGGFDNLFD